MLRREFIIGSSAIAGLSTSLAGCSKDQHAVMAPVSQAENNLAALGIELPPAPKPVANYVGYRLAGDILYIAGQGPNFKDQSFRGTVGKELSTEQGYAAARSAALNTLAQVRAGAGGSLNNVVQCLKLGGFVNCTDDFKDQPKVLNGATDLFVEVFCEAGRPARFAVGVNTLPFNVAVEIDSIWQVKL